MTSTERFSDLTEKRLLHGKDRIWLLCSAITLVFVITLYFDKQIINFVIERVSDSLVSISSFIQYYGNLPLYSIFLCVLVYSFVKNNQKLKKVSWAYIKAQIILSIILIRVLKIFFGRFRPLYGSEFTFFSLDFTRNSFPSGHATDAFISGVFIFYLLKYSKYSKYRFLPLIYAGIIALSRLAGYAHFASDVVAGMAIGVFGAIYFLERLSVQPEDTGKVR